MSTDERVPEPAPPEASAGQQLRQAREARGWTVALVAGRLRIRPALVEALEADDYAPFGAVAYARGQLRNYAALLGVDAATVLQGVSPPRLDEPGKLARNAPELHPGRPWLVRLGGAAVVVVLAVLGALWADANRERVPEVSEFVPPSESTVAPEPAATPVATSEPDASPVDVRSPAETATPREVPFTAADPVGQAADVAGSSAPPTDDQPALAAEPSTDAGLAELRLQTRAVSWVEVSDSGGQRLIYELVSPGRERTVRGVPPLRILLGNAPAVEVLYNGAPVALPAGEHVVRMILGSPPAAVAAPPSPQP